MRSPIQQMSEKLRLASMVGKAESLLYAVMEKHRVSQGGLLDCEMAKIRRLYMHWCKTKIGD